MISTHRSVEATMGLDPRIKGEMEVHLYPASGPGTVILTLASSQGTAGVEVGNKQLKR